MANHLSCNDQPEVDTSSSDVEISEADDIERPRLEDSRASLLLLPPELPCDQLMLVLPQCRGAPPNEAARNPLLSSTMMQESGLDQDWPNTSSIQLANSRDSVGISDLLNNADICLEVSADSAASNAAAASASGAQANGAAAVPSASLVSSAASASGDGDASSDDASIESISAASDSHPESSPRLRVLASATVDGCSGGSGRDCADAAADDNGSGPATRPQMEHRRLFHHQQHQQQQALGLLQVCRLALDVLSEGDLLRDGAQRWLTPELLCDKLCERLRCPTTPPAGAAVNGDDSPAADPSDPNSIAAPGEFDSPTGRVRHWLMAAGPMGSPQIRHVTNTV